MDIAALGEPSAVVQFLWKEITESAGDDADKAALLVAEANTFGLTLDEWRALSPDLEDGPEDGVLA
jgi:hypothetical protein